MAMAEKLYEIECEVTATAKIRVRICAESVEAAERELDNLGIAQVDWAPGEADNFLNVAHFDHEVVSGPRRLRSDRRRPS